MAIVDPRTELLKMRKRLLDLSGRNPLLNFRHSKPGVKRASSVRIVDEIPSQVFSQLLEGRRFEFTPLPERAAHEGRTLRGGRLTRINQEHLGLSTDVEGGDLNRYAATPEQIAAAVGINSSYELARVAQSHEGQHLDKLLQTLMFPAQMEAALSTIRSRTDSVLSETGANVLHLLFGFVAYPDGPVLAESTKERFAPLVVLPVVLKRGHLNRETEVYRFHLEWSGEDPVANVSLLEKFRDTFGTALPEFDPLSDNLEGYFSQVEAILPQSSRFVPWLTLGMVSFAKLLMYEDLDPEKWPEGRKPWDSPPGKALIGGVESDQDSDPPPMEAVLDIDRQPDLPLLITDADSSQHSAIIDVSGGRSIVIEGPPGTGKSQTIVNLIGDALRAGKRVLFVAEKAAALDVVHRRLVQAGLGASCLPLHSQVDRKSFLHDLQRCVEQHGGGVGGEGVEEAANALQQTVESLRGYSDALHQPGGGLGHSPYFLIWSSRRCFDRLPPEIQLAVEALPAVISGDHEKPRYDKLRAAVVGLAVSAAAVREDAGGMTHPWEGVTAVLTDQAAVTEVLRHTQRAMESCHRLVQAREEWSETTSLSAPVSAAAWRITIDAIQAIEWPTGLAQSFMIAIWKSRDIERTAAIAEKLDQFHDIQQHLPEGWRKRVDENDPGLSATLTDLTLARQILPSDYRIEVADQTIQCTKELLERLKVVVDVVPHLGDALSDPASWTLEGALVVTEYVARLLACGPTSWIRRAPALTLPGANETTRRLASQIDELRRRRAELANEYDLESSPGKSALRRHRDAILSAPRFLPWLMRTTYRQAISCAKRLLLGAKANRENCLACFTALIRFDEDLRAVVEAPESTALGLGELSLASPFEDFARLAEWFHDAGSAFHQAGLELAVRRALWEWPIESLTEMVDRFPSPQTVVAECALIHRLYADLSGQLGTDIDLSVERQRGLAWLQALQRSSAALDRAGAEAKCDTATTLGALAAGADKWRSAVLLHREVDEEFRWLQSFGAPVPDYFGDPTPFLVAATAAKDLQRAAVPQDWIDSAVLASDGCGVQRLTDAIASISPAVEGCLDALAGFEAGTGFVPARLHTEVLAEAPLGVLSQMFGSMLENRASLYRFADRGRFIEQLQELGLPEYSDAVLRFGMGKQAAADLFDAVNLGSLATASIAEGELFTTMGSQLGETQSLFRVRDRLLMDTARKDLNRRITSRRPPRGSAGPMVGAMTETAFIRHQAGLKRPSATVRGVFSRAPATLQTVKPCILMSPFAVAQFLERGLYEFHLVIMDEASQMRPEEALGALARASQMVVVGDTKQLGPTNFFQAARADDEEDEEPSPESEPIANEADGSVPVAPVTPSEGTVLSRSESILVAAKTFLRSRRLLWHYRSQHPKLISFSNEQFYDNELIVFPVPQPTSDYRGVHFHRVVDGCWGAEVNIIEAQEVVRAVKQHAKDHPERSLLVAAMNRKQTDLIEELISNEEKRDAALEAYRLRWLEPGPRGEAQPLVVKNLENVQGDERDAVIVSVTYGPDAKGNFFQRFGPINTEGGERRLNVLVTRARERLDVFCSFDPSQIVAPPGKNRGLRVFRDYLAYAANLQWADGKETGKEPDSDFEVSVASALRHAGYETKAQIGVAGYFIDLAVVDPAYPDRFILAVECDGATYHSSKSARDRDRLRQEHLERLGWVVSRIWSTDWFRDPAAEVNRIVARIEHLLAGR